MDRSVKPGVDFFLYANGAWYAKAEIPADRAVTGVDLRIAEVIDQRTQSLLDEAGKGQSPDLRKIGDYYAAYLDEAAIEARGLAPVAEPTLASHRFKLAGTRACAGHAARLTAPRRRRRAQRHRVPHRTTSSAPLGRAGSERPLAHRAVHLLQERPGHARSQLLPRRVRADGRAPRSRTCATSGEDPAHLAGFADAEARAARVLAFERRLAEAHGARADSEDVAKANNPWPRKEFTKRAPGMSWDAFFGGGGRARRASIVHRLAPERGRRPGRARPQGEAPDLEGLPHRARHRPRLRVPPQGVRRGALRLLRNRAHAAPRPSPRAGKRAVDATNDALGEAVGKAYAGALVPARVEARRRACV